MVPEGSANGHLATCACREHHAAGMYVRVDSSPLSGQEAESEDRIRDQV
jgi:hypothetical protein